MTQQTSPHPLNRTVVIADNLEMLKALDNETVDLIVTDPPFAKNYAFTGNLKPPLSPEELSLEKQTLDDWGINSRAGAEAAGIEWPPDNGAATAGFSDIWKWEEDIHEEWLDKVEEQYQATAKVIDAARYSHSDGHAAYLSYMAIRLIEMRRVLKPTGSLFLHCDATATPICASFWTRCSETKTFATKSFGRTGRAGPPEPGFPANTTLFSSIPKPRVGPTTNPRRSRIRNPSRANRGWLITEEARPSFSRTRPGFTTW